MTDHAYMDFRGHVPHPKPVSRPTSDNSQMAVPIYTVFFSCGKCYGGICAQVVDMGGKTNPFSVNDDLENDEHILIESIHPQIPEIKGPEHISANVKRAFYQGVDNKNREQWDAAGAMYRKALDVGTRELGANNNKLVDRIDALATQGTITADMQSWAHQVRLDGNEAAHDPEELDAETVQSLHDFTEMFLMYAFSMPGMLKARQQAKAQAEAAA